MDGKRDIARDLFIRRRLWADFEEVCETPKKCGKIMLPSSCEGCRWNSDTAFKDAQDAADRLEAKENEQQ